MTSMAPVHVDCTCAYPQVHRNVQLYVILGELFEEYWHARRAESSSSQLSELYAELLAVAVELYSFIATYQDKTSTAVPGSEDDPSYFWSLAQPHDASDDEPGIIDLYVNIITSVNFLHSPPVRNALLRLTP